jgi:AcrR family transcriptional regulator
MTATAAQHRMAPGRPRDPDLETRVLNAALEVYASHGWAGFNFDGVARAAGSGRGALYRRWHSKRELLVDALKARDARFDIEDVGSIRDQLVQLAQKVLDSFLETPRGLATLRLALDGVEHEDLRQEWDEVQRHRISVNQEIVKRGIDRGELLPDTSASQLLNAIVGSLLSRVMSTPKHMHAMLAASSSQHAANCVDFLLFQAPGMTPSHFQRSSTRH